MSPARAPGAVKARDCLLSSGSHAPGPGESVCRRITQRGRGLATKRASPKRGWVGCELGRVLKKRSAAKVWVRSARGVSSQERLGLELATRSPRERHESCPLSSLCALPVPVLKDCSSQRIHHFSRTVSKMETTTITTTQTAFTFGLTEKRATLSLHAPAPDCKVTTAHANTATADGGFQSKTKVLKRQRSSSPELLRCKRRLSFNGLGYSIPQQQPVAVARRNERERNRVKQVNMGFQTLRQHVPNGAANKKMSKVETLRSAVEYIRALQQLLDEHDAVSAAFQCGLPSPTLSNSYSADPESPHSTYSSDEGGYEPLSSEEQELLDFTTWFDRY